MHFLRPMREEDLEDHWKWKSDPLTQKFSRTQPNYEDHKLWFEETLNNPIRKVLIGILGQKKIGRVMFDRLNQDVSEIGVVIGKEFRGKGYGVQIIKEGTDEYLHTVGVKKILAEVQVNNPASIRIFQKAGYVEEVNYERYGKPKDSHYRYFFFHRKKNDKS